MANEANHNKLEHQPFNFVLLMWYKIVKRKYCKCITEDLLDVASW